MPQASPRQTAAEVTHDRPPRTAITDLVLERLQDVKESLVS